MTNTLHDAFGDLMTRHNNGPCLSLYLPTGRRYPDRRQDPVHFRNLVRDAEEKLESELDPLARNAFLRPLHELATNEAFWAHSLEGLAVLRTLDSFEVFPLPRPVPERVVVSDRFHLMPLLRIEQSANRFELLALTRDHIRLYRGSRDGIEEIPLHAEVPRTIEEALGGKHTEKSESAAGIGKMGAGSEHMAMHHASNLRKDDIEMDTARFFRVVDKAILTHHSKHSGLPLIIAGLPDNLSAFHAVSHNPQLLPDGIHGNPEALTYEAMRDQAIAMLATRHSNALSHWLELYGAQHKRGLAADAYHDVALAALGGRVRVLLVEDGRVVLGRVDPETGAVYVKRPENGSTDDVIDELAEITLRTGGEVVMVPADKMPSDTGVAAIYRF